MSSTAPATETAPRPITDTMILDVVEARSVERLSPGFVRVELGSVEGTEGLADFGVDGPTYDLRIKLIFPGASGALPDLSGADESWFTAWMDIPAEERGHMRTYTVREVRGSEADTRLVVDFVVHGDPPEGPGAAWGASARVGDQVIVLGPRRGVPWGGIEFAPGDAEQLLLLADETGAPAVAAILEQLPDDARGHAFLEVPAAADVQDLRKPPAVSVTWLPRHGRPWGAAAIPAVRRHLGLEVEGPDGGADVHVDALPAEAEDIWETPAYSSATGEAVADGTTAAAHLATYAWIAGESSVIRTLRRMLVSELGWERRQVAFMGYWREGVAMRS